MGQMQEQQAQMKEKIAQITITEKSSDGVLEVTMNGVYQITQLDVLQDDIDAEMLSDLMMITVNRLSDKISQEIERVTQESLSSILPGGLGGLGNLFGA